MIKNQVYGSSSVLSALAGEARCASAEHAMPDEASSPIHFAHNSPQLGQLVSIPFNNKIHNDKIKSWGKTLQFC